jgi:hypothetical protein
MKEKNSRRRHHINPYPDGRHTIAQTLKQPPYAKLSRCVHSLPGLSRYDASEPVRIIAFLVEGGGPDAVDDDGGQVDDGRGC